MHYFLLVIIFLWGLSVGSFLNVCIYRMPRQQSIVFPRSFCPHCHRPIAWYDNIPLLSYLILGGKCRRCGGSISVRYFLVELITGLLFIAVHLFVLRHHLPLITIPFFWFFAAALIGLSLIDLEHQIIPDRITYPLIILGFILTAFYPERLGTVQLGPAILRSFFGALAGGLSLLLIGLVGKAVFKKEAMGWGDIKLMAAVGAWQGWQMVLLAIFLGAVVASVFGIAMIVGKKARWGARIPFGPYLAVGSLITLFYGPKILYWYLYLYVR